MHVIINGDCRQELATFADEGFDAIVTDPPAGIGFMGKEWDSDRGGRVLWVQWLKGVMLECWRVLKPGGHMLVWALPRTSHWTATAIEEAGFEVRDVIHHLFGTGFPKSLNVSKAIDEKLGAARAIVGPNPNHRPISGVEYDGVYAGGNTGAAEITAPGSPEAKRFEGFGTALKPAAEHWILARKPLEGTVAAGVLEHGTGALNIDACRIDASKGRPARDARTPKPSAGVFGDGLNGSRAVGETTQGRWPANLALSHTEWCEVVGATKVRGDRRAGQGPGTRPGGFVDTGAPAGEIKPNGGVYTDEEVPAYSCIAGCPVAQLEGQATGASRFFYAAKPSKKERNAGCEHLPVRSGGAATDREEGSDGLNSPRAGAGRGGGVRNHHPTLKGIELMRWLVRLITPPGGVVLDPFCGSGTTGCAAVLEGLDFVGIEMDPEFAEIAKSRIGHWEPKVPAQENA